MLGTGAFFAKLTAFGETFATALTVTITTAHVAVGALMLVSSFVLTLKIYRFTDASVSCLMCQRTVHSLQSEIDIRTYAMRNELRYYEPGCF